MSSPLIQRAGLALLVVGFGLFTGSCSDCKCSLAPAAGATAPTGMTYLAQKELSGKNVFFSPTSAPPVPTSAMFPSPDYPSTVPKPFVATFAFSSGGASKVYSVAAGGVPGNLATPVYVGPSTSGVLCPGGSCRDYVPYRGAGGPNGDFSNDYFLRYRGIKGPDPSNDYNSLQMKFSAAGNVEADLSQYQGFVFWARGTGNFSVNLVSRKPNDFIVPAGVNPPYSGWNFYLRRFGAELNGNEEWKQIIVYFKDMVQEYGLAADRDTVIRRCTGLQFDQQVPVSVNFQLDLDYIYFF